MKVLTKDLRIGCEVKLLQYQGKISSLMIDHDDIHITLSGQSDKIVCKIEDIQKTL